MPTRLLLRPRSSAGLAACVMVGALMGGCASYGPPGGQPPMDAEHTPSPLVRSLKHVADAEDAVRLGDQERALIEFQRAIEVNPSLTSAYMGMADVYRVNGDYANAEIRYAKAAQLEPRSFDANFYHGLMLHLQQRVREAVQAYLRALAISPQDFRTTLNLATAYYQLDENAMALPYARRAVELNGDDGSARLNLGAVYTELGRHQDAVKEYQQAAELMELNGSLLLKLAESLGALSRFEEMANALDQAAKVDPSPAVHERLGFARFKLRDYDAAKANFQSALDLDKDYFPAMNGLGVCLLNDWIASGRQDLVSKDRGCGQLKRSLQIDVNQPQILELVTRYCR